VQPTPPSPTLPELELDPEPELEDTPEPELDPEPELEDTPAPELEAEDELDPGLEPLLEPDEPLIGVEPLDDPPESPELPDETGLPGTPPPDEDGFGTLPPSSLPAGGTPPKPDCEDDVLHEAISVAATAIPTEPRRSPCLSNVVSALMGSASGGSATHHTWCGDPSGIVKESARATVFACHAILSLRSFE
jgi:hypothetical protein